jgi:hypothetical protein
LPAESGNGPDGGGENFDIESLDLMVGVGAFRPDFDAGALI